MLEELRGMAEGSGVAADELMMLQVRNQFLAELDAGCTSFAVGCRRGRRPSLGRTGTTTQS